MYKSPLQCHAFNQTIFQFVFLQLFFSYRTFIACLIIMNKNAMCMIDWCSGWGFDLHVTQVMLSHSSFYMRSKYKIYKNIVFLQLWHIHNMQTFTWTRILLLYEYLLLLFERYFAFRVHVKTFVSSFIEWSFYEVMPTHRHAHTASSQWETNTRNVLMCYLFCLITYIK